MNMVLYIKRFLELISICLFSLSFYFIIRKYLERQVSISVEHIVTEYLDNPSISVCPYQSMKSELDSLIFEPTNLTGAEILESFRNQAYKRNETFFYVSYPSDSNPGFECLTSMFSSDDGKPCSFPFIYQNKSNEKCNYYMDGDYSWCLTRVRDDNTMVEDSEYWGQCNKRCEGIYV